jgi:hypothetical protein
VVVEATGNAMAVVRVLSPFVCPRHRRQSATGEGDRACPRGRTSRSNCVRSGVIEGVLLRFASRPSLPFPSRLILRPKPPQAFALHATFTSPGPIL